MSRASPANRADSNLSPLMGGGGQGGGISGE